MFLGLKNNKKVKPAKAQKKENKVYLPGDYLFWGEREVLTNEDGVEFKFVEKECFLANSNEERVVNGNSGDAFAMRKLTGINEGELYFPTLKGVDIFVTVPTEQGPVEYEIIVDDFKLGKKFAGAYTLGEIMQYANAQNNQRKNSAKQTALAQQEKLA